MEWPIFRNERSSSYATCRGTQSIIKSGKTILAPGRRPSIAYFQMFGGRVEMGSVCIGLFSCKFVVGKNLNRDFFVIYMVYGYIRRKTFRRLKPANSDKSLWMSCLGSVRGKVCIQFSINIFLLKYFHLT